MHRPGLRHLGIEHRDQLPGLQPRVAFYDANQIPADSMARPVVHALEQPANVDINEVVLRPVSQEF
ncbi:NADP-dependent 3-hydroxy acid dehydrogenase YdfG [Variovorax soli]|uniref:NADP-dependent 3-hydroxy acid dehydrogenase YdfG n=1 Tax=Variovorax soli TaxID=376815 RepID=A0ABU1N8B0_9BURK|nr:NADP-dependent 3-hydroxy acid dehydrogenase YdfG [Variovorax soli]